MLFNLYACGPNYIWLRERAVPRRLWVGKERSRELEKGVGGNRILMNVCSHLLCCLGIFILEMKFKTHVGGLMNWKYLPHGCSKGVGVGETSKLKLEGKVFVLFGKPYKARC